MELALREFGFADPFGRVALIGSLLERVGCKSGITIVCPDEMLS
jgi:hypothetical protein